MDVVSLFLSSAPFGRCEARFFWEWRRGKGKHVRIGVFFF